MNFKHILSAIFMMALLTSIAYAGRNGSGTYTAPSSSWNPAVATQEAQAGDWNDLLDDIEAAITASIAVDGQTVPTANLPMATYKHTNVGNAAARNQYATADQVQDGEIVYLTSVSGTDTITATGPLSLSAYAAGQAFRFKAGNTITGAATININSIGAKAIQKNLAALVAGDITQNDIVEIVYDGTQFQMVSPARTPVLTDGGVSGAKLTDGTVTKAKIEDLSDYTVLGNVSGGSTAPAEVSILDEDDMSSDSATALASQQSIKAYVDGLSFGKILQVRQITKTDTFSTSTDNATVTGLADDITLSSSSSKVLIIANVQAVSSNSGGNGLYIERDSTALLLGDTASNRKRMHASVYLSDGGAHMQPTTMIYLDSPGGTGPYNYSVEAAIATGTVYVNSSITDTDSANFPRGASSLILIEIGA